MARRATKQKKNGIKRPLRIPPHAPEARDEGPRLLPLSNSSERELSHVDYLVSLADIALGRKKKA